MAAGGEVLIAGQYTTSYSSAAMGIMEGDSGVPTVSQSNEGENIGNTDKYGKAVIDTIYQGANHYAQFMCMEYKASTIAAWWPFGNQGIMGVIARLGFTMAAPLVLTAVSGTPAASSPASLTSTYGILSPGYNTQLLFGPTLRKLPIRMLLYPYSSGGIAWYTLS